MRGVLFSFLLFFICIVDVWGAAPATVKTRRRRPKGTPKAPAPVVKEDKQQKNTENMEEMEKMSDEELLVVVMGVEDYIQENHVQSSSVSKELLMKGILNGMLSTYDPHSCYFSPKDFRRMNEMMKGAFGGLGIEISLNKDGLFRIIAAVDDTPAHKAELKSQDIILAVDKKILDGMSLVEVVDLLKGNPGTTVELLLKREGCPKPFYKNLERAKISIKSVKGKAEGDVAYIRISTFDDNTTTLLKKIKQELDTQIGKNLKGYVLDLRSNPGGLVDQAVAVSSLFIDTGTIVSLIGRNPEKNVTHKAVPEQVIFKDLPVVVLIDGGSASASEIVAAALQDHKKAVILGEVSFGKGSIQQIIPLGDNAKYGGFSLTVSRFYRPNGTPIHGPGVTPDLVVHPKKVISSEEPILSVREKDVHNALSVEADASETLEKKSDIEDYQLQYAIDCVKVLYAFSSKEKTPFKNVSDIVQDMKKEDQDKKEEKK